MTVTLLETWPISLVRKLLGRKRDALVESAAPDLDARTTELSPSQGLRCAAKSKKILIVDDDAVVRKTTSMKLTAAGHAVLTAVDGSEAIAAIRDEKPDIIMLDFNFPPDVANGGMPSWDGLRIMLWLRSVTNVPANRFIIMTGSAPVELDDRVKASGVLAFFRKPVDFNRLIAVIEASSDSK